MREYNVRRAHTHTHTKCAGREETIFVGPQNMVCIGAAKELDSLAIVWGWALYEPATKHTLLSAFDRRDDMESAVPLSVDVCEWLPWK